MVTCQLREQFWGWRVMKSHRMEELSGLLFNSLWLQIILPPEVVHILCSNSSQCTPPLIYFILTDISPLSCLKDYTSTSPGLFPGVIRPGQPVWSDRIEMDVLLPSFLNTYKKLLRAHWVQYQMDLPPIILASIKLFSSATQKFSCQIFSQCCPEGCIFHLY